MRKRFAALAVLVILLAGCRGLGQTPPPPPFDPDSLATALALTAAAPPPGFGTVAFPAVDDRLDDLSGYRYTVEMRFEGAFGQTSRQTSGYIRAEVWWDDVAQARRVVLVAEGDSFVSEPRRFEGVRLGDAYYLVDASGRCLLNVEDTARTIAGLEAGTLIGGVTAAPYSGTHAVLNGVEAYRYDVALPGMTLPAVHAIENSALQLSSGELWVAPLHNVVVRYYANVDVTNVRLFESQLPVTGQVFIRYDVYDLGVAQNISIPFGC